MQILSLNTIEIFNIYYKVSVTYYEFTQLNAITSILLFIDLITGMTHIIKTFTKDNNFHVNVMTKMLEDFLI